MGKLRKKSCDECSRPSWKAGKCRVHTPPMRDEEQEALDRLRREQQLEFFTGIWDKRADGRGDCYCYESGLRMFKEKYRDNTACYHHVLAKELFPQYTLVEENIVILLPEMHYLVEYNLEKAPQTYRLTQELKQKHKDGTFH